MDEALLIAVNHGFNHPPLNGLLVWVSERTTFSFPLLAILLAWSLYRAGRRGGWWFLALALTVGVADFTANQLKDVFAQHRPCYTIPHHLLPTGGKPSSDCGSSLTGMPSSHVVNFTAAAVFVTLTTPWRQWRIGLWLVTLLVALSRVYLGKHYPSQVLAGLELGLVAGIIGAWAATRAGLSHPQPRMQPGDAPDTHS